MVKLTWKWPTLSLCHGLVHRFLGFLHRVRLVSQIGKTDTDFGDVHDPVILSRVVGEMYRQAVFGYLWERDVWYG